MKVNNLIELVIRPTLTKIGLYSDAAVQLMAGTIAQESLCGLYLKQDGGPALGITMVEPATHYDIHNNYLRFKPDLAALVYKACDMKWHNIGTIPYDETLIFNLRYAVAMGRLVYARVPEQLPFLNDIAGQAEYWKRYYNTVKGKGTPQQYIGNYEKYVKPYYTKNMG